MNNLLAGIIALSLFTYIHAITNAHRYNKFYEGMRPQTVVQLTEMHLDFLFASQQLDDLKHHPEMNYKFTIDKNQRV